MGKITLALLFPRPVPFPPSCMVAPTHLVLSYGGRSCGAPPLAPSFFIPVVAKSAGEGAPMEMSTFASSCRQILLRMLRFPTAKLTSILYTVQFLLPTHLVELR